MTGHEGSWLAGLKGAKPGLWIPGEPLVRSRSCQEIAPGDAMDRGEVVSVTERMTVPAGTFVDVVKIEETTPLEPGTKECRSFLARGAGLIADGHLKLVRFGPGVEWSPTVLMTPRSGWRQLCVPPRLQKRRPVDTGNSGRDPLTGRGNHEISRRVALRDRRKSSVCWILF